MEPIQVDQRMFEFANILLFIKFQVLLRFLRYRLQKGSLRRMLVFIRQELRLLGRRES